MIEKKLTIDHIDLGGKRVLTRLDLNVPLKNGQITDDERIVRAIPTIQKIADDGGIAILCSHLGRPKGEINPELSLRPVAKRLSELLGTKVNFLDDCIGPVVEDAIAMANPGEIYLLENLRFHIGETKNDPVFATQLSSLADVFINDAFGTAHRAHASNVGVSQLVEKAAAGYLMLNELETFGKILANPQRPFISIIGGLKISSKTKVVDNLMPKVDKLLLGGGLIFTFYKALGMNVGKSFVEDEFLTRAANILSEAEEEALESETGESKVVLPMDIVCADDFDKPEKIETYANDSIPEGMMGLDIGPVTAESFADMIRSAGTVVMTGPMGVFENPRFAEGTRIILEAMAELTDKGGITAIGGGDSVSAAKKLIDPNRITHISTGGGASLEVMEGAVLPAVAALTDR